MFGWIHRLIYGDDRPSRIAVQSAPPKKAPPPSAEERSKGAEIQIQELLKKGEK